MDASSLSLGAALARAPTGIPGLPEPPRSTSPCLQPIALFFFFAPRFRPAFLARASSLKQELDQRAQACHAQAAPFEQANLIAAK